MAAAAASASAILPTMSVRSPGFPSAVAAGTHRRKPANLFPRNKPIKAANLFPRNKPIKASLSTNASEKPLRLEKPEIELEFIGPKPSDDGSYPIEAVKAVSGEKLLRNIMLDDKIELYAAYGKVMNCGGVGSCGTCIVEIIDGKDLLNERTNAELRYLKKKPESWRLACQTIVGNKENSGKVVVQRIPQWKK